MRKVLMGIVLVTMAAVVSVTGCGKKEKEEKKPPVSAELEDQEPKDGFAYEEKEYGIALTKYYGKDDKVEIPEEIDGKRVIGLESTLFEKCSQLKSVKIPVSVEEIHGGIFSKFPDVVLQGYDNTKCEEIAYNEQLTFESLGENTACVSYVDVYDSETKGVMAYTRLQDGDAGKEGEYSQGASFSIEDGVATLTLDGYNGGMIMAGGYGSLNIKLVEGSVNNINAADENEGIGVRGKLVIEGNASLSIKAGDLGSGEGIWAWSDVTIRGQVRMFVKSGVKEKVPTFALYGRAITIEDSYVELQAGQMGVNSLAIYSGSDDVAGGNIQLKGCHIEEGGAVRDIIANYQGETYQIGQGISQQEEIIYSPDEDLIQGSAEYVRIQPDTR